MRISDGLYLSKIDLETCNYCGLCIACCPGISVNMKKLYLDFFNEPSRDILIGNYLGCYIGHSNDKQIRYHSSSGGIITQIIAFYLEKGIIDGALVTRMRRDQPLIPETFIAKTREDILSASKSKYCPVPSNQALKEILVEDGKFIVVGLPCHIHGMRMAEKVFQGLKDKIFLHIGLFCFHSTDFDGTRFLLRKFGIRDSEVTQINYRGKGFPGFMSILQKNGENIDIRFAGDWNAYWNVFACFLFTPTRCLMCPDQSNELSEISIGDAWLPELRNNNLGESIIVTRTKRAEDTISLMESEGIISVKRIPASKVKESQAFSLNFKKENISGRLKLLRMFGRTLPHIEPKSKTSLMAVLGAFLPYVSLNLSSNKLLRSAIRYLPLPLFRLYFGLFFIFFMLSRNSRYYRT